MTKVKKLKLPEEGQKIEIIDNRISVPLFPIIPVIEGDGIGRDIMKATRRVIDAALKFAYDGKKRIIWFEVYAGEKGYQKYGEWLPEDTLRAIRDFRVALKGPLTTPVSGGYRSLNVALRQALDLYACVRPVKYIEGVPSPMKHPQKMDVVIFRENTEDVYGGIEWAQSTQEAKKIISFLNQNFGLTLSEDSGIGIKSISIKNTKRLVRMAIKYALEHKRRSVTLVHKGNIMKFTEGAFRDWGYEVAKEEFPNQTITEEDSPTVSTTEEDSPTVSTVGDSPTIALQASTSWSAVKEGGAKRHPENRGGKMPEGKILIQDRIADNMFQQILTRTDEYDVIAAPNLNGDYLSDACAAQVGGVGMAPGANIGDQIAIFEATGGTAPKYADMDVANPSSLILSATMMLEYLGWNESANLVQKALGDTIKQKKVTYDLERQMEGATKLKTSEFASAIIENLNRP